MKPEVSKETTLRIGRYLDGNMSREDQEEFEKDLLKDQGLKEAYLDQLGMDKAMESLILDDSKRVRKAVIAELKSKTTKETKAIVMNRIQTRRTKARIRKKRQAKRALPFVLAFAALVTISAVLLFINQKQQAVIGSLYIEAGTIQLSSNDTPIESGSIIYDGDSLKLEGTGSVRLTYQHDSTTLTLHDDSQLELLKHGKSIHLDYGEITCDVDKQKEGEVFSVHTPFAITKVVGTVFNISNNDQKTTVEMKEGVVLFQRKSDGESVEVSQGEGVSTESMKLYTVDSKSINISGLVGHWKLDGVRKGIAVDSSKNRNHGRSFNALWTKKGKIEGALIGDGASTYIDVPVKDLPYGSQAFSISVWAKTETVNPQHYKHIISYGNHAQNKSVYIGRQRNDLIIGTPGDSAGRVENLWNGDNSWHHVVLTYNGSNMKYYVDGVFIDKALRSWNIVPEKLRIGQQVNDDEFWAGAIDDVRIYNKALSLQEIKTLTNQK